MKMVMMAVCCSIGIWSAAQPMVKCFEIERVLVDACSSPEGENEMVYFRIGTADMNTAFLTVNWPANGWLTICKNAATAAKTDSINRTIQGCGMLMEPVNGVLPANSKVLLITSTNVNATAHSFAGLSDTLYVIYQCAGNTGGHFGNTGTGLRTLSMRFSGTGGCADTVSYDRALLVDINGSTGGSSTLQDGSSVAYAWDGSPTYYNNGCVAPVAQTIVNAGSDTAVCGGTPVQLQGSVSSVSGIRWFSTQGTFDTATILSPVFTASNSATSPIEIILSGFNSCDTIYDTLLVTLTSGTPPLLSIDKTLICASDSAQICAPSGFASYAWNNGETTACFHTNQAGNYYVKATDGSGCESTSQPVSLAVRPQPSVSIIRQGDTLSSYNATSYQWLKDNQPISGATSAVYIVTQSGVYSVQITDTAGCKATSTGVNVVISGIRESFQNENVKVYQPAANGTVTVELLTDIYSPANFSLYDAIGRKVAEILLTDRVTYLDSGSLSKGLYIWGMEQQGRVIARNKILMN